MHKKVFTNCKKTKATGPFTYKKSQLNVLKTPSIDEINAHTHTRTHSYSFHKTWCEQEHNWNTNNEVMQTKFTEKTTPLLERNLLYHTTPSLW